MPTNLPPEYYEVEKRYKEAQTTEEKIELLEELISTSPKHKGTDHLRADLRRRLSKFKASAQSQKQSSTAVSVYSIDKEGAGQVVVVGPANAGKSALVANTTNADPEVAVYPFTTWQPTPGMLQIDNIQVQLIDTPPLDKEFLEPELFQLIRRADLILLMVDLQADPIEQLKQSVQTLIDNRIVPLHLQDEHPERGNKFIPLLVLCNKNDDEVTDENYHIFCELMEEEWPCIPISAHTGRNLDGMKKAIFDKLDIIRVYSKAPGAEPDLSSPFIAKKGSTVAEFARKIHKDFYDNLKSARVWGSGDFNGQMVSRDHELLDEDVVELKI
jgi:small GTP-binding protein